MTPFFLGIEESGAILDFENFKSNAKRFISRLSLDERKKIIGPKKSLKDELEKIT